MDIKKPAIRDGDRIKVCEDSTMWCKVGGEFIELVARNALFYTVPSAQDYPPFVNPRPMRERIKRASDRALEHGMADVAATLEEVDGCFKAIQNASNVCLIKGVVKYLGKIDSTGVKKYRVFSVAFIRKGSKHPSSVCVLAGPGCYDMACSLCKDDFVQCYGMVARQARTKEERMSSKMPINVYCHHIEIIRTAQDNDWKERAQ